MSVGNWDKLTEFVMSVRFFCDDTNVNYNDKLKTL